MNQPILLRIDGLVQNPLELTAADLARLSPESQIDDVSRIDPKRRGRAIKLAAVLANAGLQPSADYLTLHASRDDFHASVPLASVVERGIVIYELEGAPLPVSAGGPIRFYIPDFAACHSAEVDECANVKFVDRIELTQGPGRDNRPHDEKQHAELHEKIETVAMRLLEMGRPVAEIALATDLTPAQIRKLSKNKKSQT